MSRIRTGHRPDDWLVLDPASGRSHSKLGIKGGVGNPVIFGSYPVGVSQTARNRQHGATFRLKEVAPPSELRSPMPKPVCGAPLPLEGGTCARSPGHGWDHKSRYTMDNAAQSRRSTRIRLELVP